MEADHKIHKGWGHHIEWWTDNWASVDFNNDSVRAWGHLPQIPKAGETLMDEFERTFTKFKIIKVDCPGDPRDMFFLTCKPIEQEVKATGEIRIAPELWYRRVRRTIAKFATVLHKEQP